MNEEKSVSMRDVFIEMVWQGMEKNSRLIFLSDDFGARALDKIRRDFPGRFINSGIAEQNLINIATGLALEGFTVYAYGIAPFLTMRPFEQMRNLSLLAQKKKMNVNLVSVGAGLSYDISGPSHHCCEDIALMRLLPNVEVFSPSDWILTKEFAEITFSSYSPKYLRLDAKPLPRIYQRLPSFQDGFSYLKRGKGVCLVATGYMTHVALKVAHQLQTSGINVGVIDVFLLKGVRKRKLFHVLKTYDWVITIEEGFIDSGGLDSVVGNLLIDRRASVKLKRIGFQDRHVFENGDRSYLHRLYGLDEKSVGKIVERLWKKKGF